MVEVLDKILIIEEKNMVTTTLRAQGYFSIMHSLYGFNCSVRFFLGVILLSKVPMIWIQFQ
jgi:hypothetical protein